MPMNSSNHDQIRLQLMEWDVVLVTFSEYWYGDETHARHFKAWAANGYEKKISDDFWDAIGFFLLDETISITTASRPYGVVYGWQIANDTLQIAAPELHHHGRYGDPEDQNTDMIVYNKAKEEWGGWSNPNFEYVFKPNLSQLFAASAWSPQIENANIQLEQFFGDHDEFVRAALAANPNAPEEILLELASDPSPHVRNSIRMNPRTPAWIQQSLGLNLE
jgi:Leucine rich repeat variant